MKCLACGTETDQGPVVAKKLRPLCGPCRRAWEASGECTRYAKQAETLLEGVRHAEARAFTDWLTRVRTERRNAETGRGARTA